MGWGMRRLQRDLRGDTLQIERAITLGELPTRRGLIAQGPLVHVQVMLEIDQIGDGPPSRSVGRSLSRARIG